VAPGGPHDTAPGGLHDAASDGGLHGAAPGGGPHDTAPGGGPIRFIESDLFDRIPPAGFDLIISNPPYVPAGIIPGLAPEVRREPRLALDGGEDGLDLIRRIVQKAPDHLRAGGTLLMEADPGQMEAVAGILASRGFLEVQTYQDLSHRDRVIGGRLSPQAVSPQGKRSATAAPPLPTG
jgi:release factor glutamine methyltransferase